MTAARTDLLLTALVAGLLQVLAGATMYLTGVYFTRWSMGVTFLVLLACIIIGTLRHGHRHPGSTATYGAAVRAGMVIGLVTGIVYAIYTLVSITWLYHGFLDEVRQMMPAGSDITAPRIALGNLLRLTALGTVLSLVTAPFTRRRPAAAP